MFCSFEKEADLVHIDYLTDDLKTDLTYNFGTFFAFLNGFQKRNYSNRILSMAKNPGGCSLIRAKLRSFVTNMLGCLKKRS